MKAAGRISSIILLSSIIVLLFTLPLFTQYCSAETIVDNLSEQCERTGMWTSSLSSLYYYDIDYEYGTKGVGKKEFIWNIDIEEEGFYTIKVHWCKANNRATSAYYTVQSQFGIETFYVNQQEPCGNGYDTEDWHELGLFPLLPDQENKVILSDDANGFVIADAIAYDKFQDLHKLLVDNTDPSCTMVGDWGVSTTKSNFFGENYRHKFPGQGYSKFTWNFWVEEEGNYDLFAWWPIGGGTASDAKYNLKHADGETTVQADQRYNGGGWNKLGTFNFQQEYYSVTLNNDADGFVIADAILLRKHSQDERLLVDDVGPYCTFKGPWYESQSVSGYFGRGYHCRKALPEFSVKWTPKLAASGTYEVFVRWTSAKNRSQKARYTVYHGLGSSSFTFDQQENGGKWISLGIFPFSKGESAYVTLDGEDDGFLIADAVKFVYQKPFNAGWYVRKITDTTNISELCPVVDNGQLAWLGKGKKVIQVYDGSEIITIFDITDLPDAGLSAPNISNGGVVWREYNGSDVQTIYLWDGLNARIIDSYVNEGHPYVVEPYWGYPPSIHCLNPTIDNGRVAYPKWDGHDYEIYVWQNGNVTQITNNDLDDLEPSINGDLVAFVTWNRNVSQSQDILVWNGELFSPVGLSSTDDQDPDTDGERIVFCAWNTEPNKKFDIYVWDKDILMNVSQKDGSDYEPQIDGTLIAWHGQDAPGEDFDIYVFDGKEIVSLAKTDQDEIHAWVSGSDVCWTASDGIQYDIYLATKIE